MTTRHIIRLPRRTGSLEVTEESTRIVLKLRFDRYGSLGDDAELLNWLRPIFDQYSADQRPMVMDNPTTGEVAIIG